VPRRADAKRTVNGMYGIDANGNSGATGHSSAASACGD
jgi:phage gp45-like